MIQNYQNSHIKLLKYNNIDLNTLTNENIKRQFDNLKTLKNKSVSNNYKISILQTIKVLNNDITLKPHDIKLHTTRKSTTEIINKKALLNIIRYTYNLTDHVIAIIDTSSLIDALLALFLITATNIKLKDLYTLTLPEYKKLSENDTIIKTTKILKNPSLFTLSQPIINMLINHREATFTTDAYITKPKFTTHVITCTYDVINKRIHDLYSSINTTTIDSSLGLKSFRILPDIIYDFIRISNF